MNNQSFFARARLAQGRQPEESDIDQGKIGSNANVFAGLSQAREARVNENNPRGLKGGEYGRSPLNRNRRRISGGNAEKAAKAYADRDTKDDAFFAMADRARHADPTRPKKTRDQYAVGQRAAVMDLEQDANWNPEIRANAAKAKANGGTMRTVEEDIRLNQRRERMKGLVAAAEAKESGRPVAALNDEQKRQQKFSNTSADDISARAKAVVGTKAKVSDGKLDVSNPEVHRAMTDSFAAINRRESAKRR